MEHISFHCISLTKLEMVIFPSTMTEGRTENYSSELPEDPGLPVTPFSHPSPFLHTSLQTLHRPGPQGGLLGRTHMCPAACICLCFVLSGVSLRPEGNSESVCNDAAVVFIMTSCGRRQNKNLSVRIRWSQIHVECLCYAASGKTRKKKKRHGLCP